MVYGDEVDCDLAAIRGFKHRLHVVDACELADDAHGLAYLRAEHCRVYAWGAHLGWETTVAVSELLEQISKVEFE